MVIFLRVKFLYKINYKFNNKIDLIKNINIIFTFIKLFADITDII